MTFDPHPKVILCGPYPSERQFGGIARWDELIATSPLQDRYGIHRLPVTLPGEGGLARRMWTDLRRTHRCLQDVDAPIFHLTSQYLLGTYREYAQYRLAISTGRRFVYDIRGGCFIESYEDPRAPLRRRLLCAMISSASAVTVEGKRYVDWIEQKFDRTATWVPNFVQARHAREYPRASLEPLRPGEPVRVAFSGRLVPEKGLEALIRATARLKEQQIPVHLSLLGGGDASYERSLHDLVRSNSVDDEVTFTGTLDHGEVLRQLASQHIFAFPTQWWGEGHSNAVNEAMQVGLPILATRHGFLADVVSPECGTLLADPHPESLADAIQALVGDWERLRASGAAAYSRVYREFSDDVALARLAETWDRVLSGPTGGGTRPATEASQ